MVFILTRGPGGLPAIIIVIIVIMLCFAASRVYVIPILKVDYKPQNTLWRREMTVMASRITGQSNVCSAVYLDCPFVRGAVCEG